MCIRDSSTIVFGISLVCGLFLLPFNKRAAKGLINSKTWLMGIVLGLANFGSMYFLILALNHVDIKTGLQAMGSIVFGINNIGIVALSVVSGFFFFRERPSAINWIGIGLSFIAIAILSIS